MNTLDWKKPKLILSTRDIRLCYVYIFLGITIALSLSNCGGTTTGITTATIEAPTKQSDPFLRQMPQEPHVFVSISGLDDTAIVYTNFRTLSGHVPVKGSHPGNGEKRVVLPGIQGEIYFVTAAAEGYISHPISYTIQLSGEIFYLVENGLITANEASNLKFQFTPVAAPTDD